MIDAVQRIGEIGVVPVVTLKEPERGPDLARALCEGDLPVAEITFRTAGAAEAIRRIVSEVPQVLTGAGTVITVDQARAAKDAGAAFIVCPGMNEPVVRYCLENEIPVIPGAVTATEVERGVALGLDLLKFFPAEASGGPGVLKALSAPFGSVRFMPTGGITPDNLRSYLSLPSVIACGGSWMVPSGLIASGEYSSITALASSAVRRVLGFTMERADNAENDAVRIETGSSSRVAAYLRWKNVEFEERDGVILLADRPLYLGG